MQSYNRYISIPFIIDLYQKNKNIWGETDIYPQSKKADFIKQDCKMNIYSESSRRTDSEYIVLIPNIFENEPFKKYVTLGKLRNTLTKPNNFASKLQNMCLFVDILLCALIT